MRHWALALVTLCATAVNAAAQTSDRFLAAFEPVRGVEADALTVDPVFVTADLRGLIGNAPTTTPDVVVARLMSFDRNKDGRVTRDELSERMQGVVARGDRGGDGALDAAEIRNLAVAPAAGKVWSFGANGSSGGYGFGDEFGFSTRMHIEGAVDDLRLAAGSREQAMAIATAFADRHEKQASTELASVLASMLSADQLKTFTNGLEQMSQGNASAHVAPASRILPLLSVLSVQLSRSSLSPEQRQQATAALVKFKERQQLAESDRTQLLAQLEDTLTVEERENLNASLARRPLVKNSLPVKITAEVIRGGVRVD